MSSPPEAKDRNAEKENMKRASLETPSMSPSTRVPKKAARLSTTLHSYDLRNLHQIDPNLESTMLETSVLKYQSVDKTSSSDQEKFGSSDSLHTAVEKPSVSENEAISREKSIDSLHTAMERSIEEDSEATGDEFSDIPLPEGNPVDNTISKSEQKNIDSLDHSKNECLTGCVAEDVALTLSVIKQKVEDERLTKKAESASTEEYVQVLRESMLEYSFNINESYCHTSILCENCCKLNKELSVVASKLEGLIANNASQNSVNNGLNKDYEEAKQKISVFQEKMNDLEVDLKDYEETKEIVEVLLEKMKNMEADSKENEEAKQKVEDLQKKIAIMKKENIDAKEKVEMLEKRVTTMKANLLGYKEAKLKMQTQEDRIFELEERLKQNEESMERVSVLRNKISDLSAEAREGEEAKCQVVVLKNRVTELEAYSAEHMVSKQKVKTLQKKITAFEEVSRERDETMRKNVVLHAKVSELIAKLGEIDVAKRKEKTLLGKINNLETELKGYEDAKRKITCLQNKVAALEAPKTSTKSKKKVKALENRITELEANLLAIKTEDASSKSDSTIDVVTIEEHHCLTQGVESFDKLKFQMVVKEEFDRKVKKTISAFEEKLELMENEKRITEEKLLDALKKLQTLDNVSSVQVQMQRVIPLLANLSQQLREKPESNKLEKELEKVQLEKNELHEKLNASLMDQEKLKSKLENTKSQFNAFITDLKHGGMNTGKDMIGTIQEMQKDLKKANMESSQILCSEIKSLKDQLEKMDRERRNTENVDMSDVLSAARDHSATLIESNEKLKGERLQAQAETAIYSKKVTLLEVELDNLKAEKALNINSIKELKEKKSVLNRRVKELERELSSLREKATYAVQTIDGLTLERNEVILTKKSIEAKISDLENKLKNNQINAQWEEERAYLMRENARLGEISDQFDAETSRLTRQVFELKNRVAVLEVEKEGLSKDEIPLRVGFIELTEEQKRGLIPQKCDLLKTVFSEKLRLVDEAKEGAGKSYNDGVQVAEEPNSTEKSSEKVIPPETPKKSKKESIKGLLNKSKTSGVKSPGTSNTVSDQSCRTS